MRMVADVEEEVGDAIEGTAARAQTACEAAGAGLRGRCGGGGFNIIAQWRGGECLNSELNCCS
jgi:hypothetical protein